VFGVVRTLQGCVRNRCNSGWLEPTDRHMLKNIGERIVIHPHICNGGPIVCGMRIAVQSVLEFLAAGDSVEDVLEESPDLAREDVQASIGYASRLIGNAYSVEAVARKDYGPQLTPHLERRLKAPLVS
jgi:uncharacterized protein (DUF433 family)